MTGGSVEQQYTLQAMLVRHEHSHQSETVAPSETASRCDCASQPRLSTCSMKAANDGSKQIRNTFADRASEEAGAGDTQSAHRGVVRQPPDEACRAGGIVSLP